MDNTTAMYMAIDIEAAAQAAGEPIQPGDAITLTNVGTDSPCIVLPSGKNVQGVYKETVGTHMVYREQVVSGGDDQPPTRHVQVRCTTTQLLTFPTQS